jgi:signal transduction histidine kinase
MIGMRSNGEVNMAVQGSTRTAPDGRRPNVRWTIAGLGILDIAAATVLSGIALAAGLGWLHLSGGRPGIAAAAGVLAMTLPVAWRRPAPVSVAGFMAAAALLNGLIFGSIVRCGVALPAFFLVVFSVGARRDRAWSALGLALCVGGVIAEGMYDPQIEASGLAFVLPVLVAFFAAGRLVRARSQMAKALRLKSAELRRQREQTARLAVLADRAEISADLEQALHAQIGGIAAAAATGLNVLDDDHAAARQAMATIEHDGRQALEHMRELLGSLRDAAPSEPQPTLARLPDLLASATTASARLTIEGNPRTLPAGLELTGYRIVERLLEALEDTPEAAIDVLIRFCSDAVELHVSGPSSVAADLRAVLAAATERASLHSGTVQHRLEGRFCYASARLPLVSGHA